MTQDEIIEMAKQAGMYGLVEGGLIEEFEVFAKLVAAKAIAVLESQEPVGEVDAIGLNETDFHVSFKRSMPLGTKLYAHPPQRTEQEQPLPPVEIGVDVTADGASVVAFYRRPNAVMEMFYSQFHPAPQRTWVGLTNNELQPIADEYRILFGSWVEDFARDIEAKLKEKNT